MADSILRLRVESTEYDSKLKKASQGLQHYIDNCRKAGGTLSVVEDNTLAFVRALGDMPTVAQGGTQSLREMTRSLADLTMQYRSLSDEEKNSPFGQAMAQSIQSLTERAGQARDTIDDVNATIKNAASDTRVFDQIAGAAGLATASFQTLQGASKLLGVDIGNDVEVIAKLQAAMAVTNGLTQIQTALQKESALMQGIQTIQTKALAAAQALNATNTTAATVAQGAFNAVAKANPYVLLASAIIAVGTAVVAYTRHTKEAAEETKQSEAAMNRAKAAADSYRKSMSSSFADMMTKYDELKRAWLSLADTHQKQQWINDNKKAFEELGLSINNIKGAEDAFENNTGKIVDSFRRRAQAAALAARMVELYRQKMDLELQAKEVYDNKRVSAYDVVGNRVTSFTRDAGADTYNEGRYGMNAQGQYYFTAKGAKDYNEQLFTSNKQLKSMNDEYKEINRQIDESNQKLMKLQSTITTITGNGKGSKSDAIIPVGSIADLTQKMQDLKTAQSLVTNNDDWVKYQEQIKHVEYQINALKGEWERGLQATFDFGASEQFRKMTDAGRQMLQMFGDGNVDLLTRPLVDAAELVKKGWKDAGDGIATVFSYQRQIEDSTGHPIEILVTPILPDGTVLSEDELNQYIDDKIWGANDILAADDKGIIIKVGASEDGTMGEVLHDLQAVYYMTDQPIDLKVDENRLRSIASIMAEYIRTGKIGGNAVTEDVITISVDDTEALAKIAEVEGATIADKTVMVTAHNAEALQQLAEIQGVTILDKTVTVQADTADAYNQIAALAKDIDGTTVTFSVKPEIDRAIGKSITTSSGLTDLINSLKKEIQDADFGSDLYNTLTKKLADATMLQNLVKESLSVGLGTALFDIADETGQDFWDRVLSPEGVENADWQAIADVINRKRKEMGLDAITLDFNSGNVSAKSKTNNDTEIIDTGKKLVGGLSQVSSGLDNMGIKLSDEANQFINTAQGIISVIEGLKAVAEVITGSTSSALVSAGVSLVQALFTNTMAVTANTTATAAAAAADTGEAIMDAIKVAAVAMAHGGVVPHAAQGYAVPGRHYSGDVTPIMANAGELVLNRAQQGNLASQLQEGDHQTSAPARPYVTGQDIFLGLNNYLTGSGQGEIITSKNIKSYIN